MNIIDHTYINRNDKGGIMKSFSNIMDMSTNKLSLAQNTRADIVGELEAIIQYENHIASSNDSVVNQTLRDIVTEERVHVGQLFGLLFYLDPDSQKYFEQGLNEFFSTVPKNN